MAQLFNRVARLILTPPGGGTQLTITGLRIQFKIKKTLRFEPNAAEIQVYNLTDDHRSQCKTRGTLVTLAAGYSNTIGQIFSGQVIVTDNKRQGADWITKIQAGDGVVNYRYARLSKSYNAGSAVATVCNDLIAALGPATLDTQNSLAQITDQFLTGYAVQGPVAKELDRILKGRGYTWSIQDGKVQVLPIGGSTQETAIVLSPTTGLLDSPEHGTPPPSTAGLPPVGTSQSSGLPKDKSHVLKVKSLLQPTIRPGVLLSVQAKGITGLFRTMELEHSGDTHGGEWYTEAECVPKS